jgi:hypothetical protein
LSKEQLQADIFLLRINGAIVKVIRSFFQGNRIWDAPPSALPGANLLKRVPNISK